MEKNTVKIPNPDFIDSCQSVKIDSAFQIPFNLSFKALFNSAEKNC